MVSFVASTLASYLLPVFSSFNFLFIFIYFLPTLFLFSFYLLRCFFSAPFFCSFLWYILSFHLSLFSSFSSFSFFSSSIQGGIFAGLDDLWLELASGCFSLEMIPCCHKHENKPIIQIMLSGNKADSSSNHSSNSISEVEKDDGMSIRLKVEGFKLAGDKGKRVPKLKLQSVSVTMVLRVSITLEFDEKINKVKIYKYHILSF